MTIPIGICVKRLLIDVDNWTLFGHWGSLDPIPECVFGIANRSRELDLMVRHPLTLSIHFFVQSRDAATVPVLYL
jgi:hypothetical protein